MAASGLQFNCHRQMAETLHVLTSDYTTDTVAVLGKILFGSISDTDTDTLP